MPRLRPPLPATALAELSDAQGGAVSRRQVTNLGMTDDQIARSLRRDWQPSGLPGVYLTFTGPVAHLSRCWTALLYAGTGAALCLDTAAWIWGLRDEPPDDVHIMIVSDRRVKKQPGMRIHLRTHLPGRRHPARVPTVVRLEETVLDMADRATPDEVIGLVLRACQRRLTTPDRIRSAADGRATMRHRQLVTDLLDEAVNGVQSTLERRYLHDVERAHGLPRGARNMAEEQTSRRRYRDVRYLRYCLVVELDGRAAHPQDRRELDDLRDNDLLLDEGTRTLRYGWRSVAVHPCETAGQVVELLRSGGWDGAPRHCSANCRLPQPDGR